MKKLVINPTKEESKDLEMLRVDLLILATLEKVLHSTEATFKPLVTKEGHIKSFISNVGYKLVSISQYAGKELNSMQEAIDYFLEIGKSIYGNKNWPIELLKNEVRHSKTLNFGVRVNDPELVQYIKTRLLETESNLEVVANKPPEKVVEPKQKPNAKKEETDGKS